jgi:predicted ferric reductase
MSLLFRGIVWFGLYLLLVLLPLAVALVIGDGRTGIGPRDYAATALGITAFAVVIIEFGLVSRLNAASEPFGTDALMQFHRLMGIGALLMVALHALAYSLPPRSLQLLNPLDFESPSQSGAAALWLLAALVTVSVYRRRLRIPYEAWQVTHGAAAATIVAAAFWHALQLGAFSAALGTRVLLTVYVAALALLMLRYRMIRPWLLRRRPWEVLDNRDEGASTRTLALRPVGHRGFDYLPGQFAWISTARSPLSVSQHPLSLSSSAELGPDRSIEFSIKALGDWSAEKVPALSAGDRVWVDGPYGAFTPDREPGMGFVMISGGSGIAPIRSMLLTLRDRGDPRPVLLVHGSSTPGRMAYLADLGRLQAEMNLRFIPVFEHAPAGTHYEQGYVTKELLGRYLPARRNDYQYFVCGPAAMMDSVELALIGLDVAALRIHTERFDLV